MNLFLDLVPNTNYCHSTIETLPPKYQPDKMGIETESDYVGKNKKASLLTNSTCPIAATKKYCFSWLVTLLPEFLQRR
jgi:hypothetical protein